MYTTFLASAFRSIRFGINEAHGRGIAIQLNYAARRRRVPVNADGTFRVDAAEDRATRWQALTPEIMTVQAEGDYAQGQGADGKLGVVRPAVQTVLDRLAQVPVDIEPHFVSDETLR